MFVSVKDIFAPAVNFESKKFGVVSFEDTETLTSVSAWIATQADPFQTFRLPADELKYNAPVAKEFPSLSVDGAEDLDPKYVSSKLSRDAAAEEAELAAAVADDEALLACVEAVEAELDALLACVDAVDADEAAAVAELAAFVALVAAPFIAVCSDEVGLIAIQAELVQEKI